MGVNGASALEPMDDRFEAIVFNTFDTTGQRQAHAIFAEATGAPAQILGDSKKWRRAIDTRLLQFQNGK